MREHMGLFRGKRIDTGEWVEGNLWQDPDLGVTSISWFEYYSSEVGLQRDYNVVDVDPDSIGECTSLRDKNGKLIFEGDIVKATIIRDMGGGETARVEQGVIGYDSIGMLGLINHFFEGTPVYSDFFQELALSGLISDYYFEIIGNVHDNPELLKGGEGDG